MSNGWQNLSPGLETERKSRNPARRGSTCPSWELLDAVQLSVAPCEDQGQVGWVGGLWRDILGTTRARKVALLAVGTSVVACK